MILLLALAAFLLFVAVFVGLLWSHWRFARRVRRPGYLTDRRTK